MCVLSCIERLVLMTSGPVVVARELLAVVEGGRCHAQGIRRVVAVTSAEAEAALARAEALTKAMEAAQKLTGPELEAEIATLRQVRHICSLGSWYH